MLPLIATVLIVLAPCLINAQDAKQEWAPDELYNPLIEPRKCGHSSDQPAYICDPNRILGDHIRDINWILRDAAYNSTRCPCSNYYCETRNGALGYRIGVALVKRMKIQASLDGSRNTPEDQAQLFAYRLENNRWNMGQCEEDIVIFYSVEDKVLAIYGGSTATAKLTPYYRDLVAHKVGTRLSDGRIIEALHHMVRDIKLILNCDTTHEYGCGLHEIRNSASSINISLTVSLVAVFLSVFLKL